MARKHIDESRCKLCKAVYPDESDQIIEVWTQRHEGDDMATQFLGHFCEFCLPSSAHIGKHMTYVIDKRG